MFSRSTFALIFLYSSLVADENPGRCSFQRALSVFGGKEIVLGAVGFSGSPDPERWLFLISADDGKMEEKAVEDGEVVATRSVERLTDQDLPDIPLDLETIRIDSNAAFGIASESARENRVEFDSAHFHLRCRNEGNEPVWLLKLLGPRQDSRGLVYLSASTGEILRTAWTIREIENFALASPLFRRTDR